MIASDLQPVPVLPPGGMVGMKRGSSMGGHGISDSGYLSHATNDTSHPHVGLRNASKSSSERSGGKSDSTAAAVSEPATGTQLSEQTIHAMLRPLSFRGTTPTTILQLLL